MNLKFVMEFKFGTVNLFYIILSLLIPSTSSIHLNKEEDNAKGRPMLYKAKNVLDLVSNDFSSLVSSEKQTGISDVMNTNVDIDHLLANYIALGDELANNLSTNDRLFQFIKSLNELEGIPKGKIMNETKEGGQINIEHYNGEESQRHQNETSYGSLDNDDDFINPSNEIENNSYKSGQLKDEVNKIFNENELSHEQQLQKNSEEELRIGNLADTNFEELFRNVRSAEKVVVSRYKREDEPKGHNDNDDLNIDVGKSVVNLSFSLNDSLGNNTSNLADSSGLNENTTDNGVNLTNSTAENDLNMLSSTSTTVGLLNDNKIEYVSEKPLHRGDIPEVDDNELSTTEINNELTNESRNITTSINTTMSISVSNNMDTVNDTNNKNNVLAENNKLTKIVQINELFESEEPQFNLLHTIHSWLQKCKETAYNVFK